jgi:adenosylmethionine---8-amino-7-oxononanoate aminotransferase
VARLSARLDERLQRDILPLAHVGDIRQRGVMVGIELVRDRTPRTAYAPADRIGHRVILAARRRGVIIRPLGNVVVLMPPLAMSLADIDLLVDAVRAAILEVTEA